MTGCTKSLYCTSFHFPQNCRTFLDRFVIIFYGIFFNLQLNNTHSWWRHTIYDVITWHAISLYYMNEALKLSTSYLFVRKWSHCSLYCNILCLNKCFSFSWTNGFWLRGWKRQYFLCREIWYNFCPRDSCCLVVIYGKPKNCTQPKRTEEEKKWCECEQRVSND